MSEKALEIAEENNNSKEEKSQHNPQEYAAIYARKSTKLENNSLHSQAALARQEIEKRNLFLYDIYEDEESATKYHPMHRPGFKRLVYDAKQKKFKTLIVFRRDRLARKVEDLIEIKYFLKKQGIKIIYSNQGEYQTDENSYLSSFIENIIISVDELEPTILAERIAAGKLEKRKRGEYAATAPYGYESTKDKEGKKIIYKKEDEAKVVKAIFDGFLNGVKNEEDFLSFIKKLSTTYGNKKDKFNYTKITKILLRPLYGGLILLDPEKHISKTVVNDENNEYTVDKSLYVKCIELPEPIVEPEKWFESLIKWKKIILKNNTIENEASGEYLFKGKIKCMACDETVFLMKNVHAYRCTKGCTEVNELALQDYLLECLIKYVLIKVNLEDIHTKRLKKINKDIEDMQKKIDDYKFSQTNEMSSLIKGFSEEKSTDYSNIINFIHQEMLANEKLNSLKEDATKINTVLEKICNIRSTNDSKLLISTLKSNSDLTIELINSLIKKVEIRSNKDVNIGDSGSCKVSYKYV